ncbi:hypothetical protein ACIBVL_23235 [Streptomyces sp. NPDC049687]|uniref:hypothetical protein n=1 Tax=Streptomyces sp. NPDC049687 TaxID=3365596 RepID=UPI0037973168
MSEDQSTATAEATNAEAAEVTTLNTHATSEPLKTAKATAEDTTAGTDNTHATDETA